MKYEGLKTKELSSREKAKLERAESLVPEIFNLREKTGISMKQAIIEILKRKAITAQEDVEYYTRTIPSLAGKRSAKSREKQRIAEAEEEARHQELKERDEGKHQRAQETEREEEKQFDLFT